MQEADGKEHEVAGCNVGRESTGGDSHVTVRLQKQTQVKQVVVPKLAVNPQQSIQLT